MTDAPGWPGIPPRWTSSAKSGVGTAISSVSRVWFTLSHGILDEIYYPRVDQACTRDFGFIVTDGSDFFAEEKRDCTSDIARLEDGVPAFRLINTHKGGRFRIIKDVLTDQWADVVMQRVRLEVLDGSQPAAIRAACTASGQRRRAQHRLDRRVQGPSVPVRRGRRHDAFARLLASIPRVFRGLCRCFGWLANPAAERPTQGPIRTRR